MSDPRFTTCLRAARPSSCNIPKANAGILSLLTVAIAVKNHYTIM